MRSLGGRMSVAGDPVRLRISVQPSPETNDHEVLLMGDDQDLVARFGDGSIGLDPDNVLTSPCPLIPGMLSRARTRYWFVSRGMEVAMQPLSPVRLSHCLLKPHRLGHASTGLPEKGSGRSHDRRSRLETLEIL